MPPALLEHHQALVDDGQVASWEDIIATEPKGWFLESLGSSNALYNCYNSVFGPNHCYNSGGYNGSICKFNDGGSWQNIIGWVSQYKAGFCKDDYGTYADWLAYKVCGTSNWNVIWASNNFGTPTYLSWEWIAPSATRRAWDHYGLRMGSNSGVRDWGSKWGTTYEFCGP